MSIFDVVVVPEEATSRQRFRAGSIPRKRKAFKKAIERLLLDTEYKLVYIFEPSLFAFIRSGCKGAYILGQSDGRFAVETTPFWPLWPLFLLKDLPVYDLTEKQLRNFLAKYFA